jgi:sulfatase modifying factor 1
MLKTLNSLQPGLASLLLLCVLSVTAYARTSTAPVSFRDETSGLNFVSIPAGHFIMGTPERLLDLAIAEMPKPRADLVADETPAHTVVLDHAFNLSATEVTQQAWYHLMKTRPGPDRHWQHNNWQQLPVVSVSWNDAQQFIEKLNALSTRYHYRLPTEAEWEYAARAGNDDLRPFSKLAMDEYAWYLLNSNDEIQPVAQLEANGFGLYDMYGNAWEWVSDWYQPNSYASAGSHNPPGAELGDKKVRRGGSYHCAPHLVRSAYRAADPPDTAYSVLGFRLVAEAR